MNDIHICPECGELCEPIKCDNGIGPGEFWGAKFNDTHPFTGSSCCEAKLEDVSAWYDVDARADYEYDRMKDERGES